MAVFNYSGSADELVLVETGDRRPGYAIHRFTMPASFENGQPGNSLTGTYYASLSAGNAPLVIVLPVWGVSEYPSVKMTRTLLNRSRGRVNVLLVDGSYRLMPWQRIAQSENLDEFIAGLSNAAQRLKHAVIDTRRLIDWAETRTEIDAQRIGLVGFSISAITGTLVAQSDRRIRSSALVMGGAQIAKIVSNCPGNEKTTREAIMSNLGLELEEYEQVISGKFEELDPAHYPHRVNPRSVLIIDAGKDDCIPETSREAWWEALGRPERISMNYSHRGSFLAMTPLGFNLLRKRVYEHLEKTL
ncbi:MAG: hypothetical protein U5R46_07065 [Gammaproteobacteria bacterium]|nr:hypothetical protein [Gammaproteobacteria bacterium]